MRFDERCCIVAKRFVNWFDCVTPGIRAMPGVFFCLKIFCTFDNEQTSIVNSTNVQRTFNMQHVQSKIPGVTITRFIGIDAGVNTGFAVWDAETSRFNKIATTTFWGAIQALESEHMELAGKQTDVNTTHGIAVYIENPNGNRPTFGKHQAYREKISQNVGMNKRDAQLLIEYCKNNHILFFSITPGKHSMTKMKPEAFAKYTGYDARTSSHGRDAAMLVYGKTKIFMSHFQLNELLK